MIRAIATDMDGTFLNSAKNYDREQFDRVYAKMCQQDIKFIVASGNQYEQLKAFFPGKADDIAFVSDNGSQIFEHDQLVNATTIPRPVVTHILADVFKLESLKHVTLSGLRSAYILESATPAGRQNARQYYYKLKEVSDFPTVDDDISKINLLVDDAVKDSVTATINERFPTAASMYCGRSVRPVKSCSFKRSIYSSVFLFK